MTNTHRFKLFPIASAVAISAAYLFGFAGEAHARQHHSPVHQGTGGHNEPTGMQAMHHPQHSMKMGTAALTKLRALKGRQFDVAFLSQMIPHHQAALTMARDARPTLTDKRVRQHAQNILTSQAREIAEMNALLRSDYKTAPSAAHANLMKADMKGMMAMKTRGDRMFLEMMIPHHQGAVDMSRLASTNGAGPKVRALASRILKEQKAEIADFQKLLSQGVGNVETHPH